MVRMPAPKGKTAEILFVYGQHSSQERWWGLLKYANRFGAITAPDLPGFGGMTSFHAIGKRPTLDNYADYLAAFVKMRYRRKKVAIVGMSLGFAIATRMLQRYPELSRHVTLLVSLAGFTHWDDFSFGKRRMMLYRSLAAACSHWLPATFFRYVLLNRHLLRRTYHRTLHAREKFAAAKDAEEHERFMDMEIDLWHRNDVRTYARTLAELLTLNNCTSRLDVPVWHVNVDSDQYLNPHRVEQHLRIAFSNVHIVESHLKSHAPSIIATEDEVAPLIPKKLRRVLAKL